MLFDKIQDSDVVDMGNMTLEQEVLRDLTGSRHSYVAVLTAKTKGTLAIYDGGTDVWLRDNHIFRDVNVILQNCRIR